REPLVDVDDGRVVGLGGGLCCLQWRIKRTRLEYPPHLSLHPAPRGSKSTGAVWVPSTVSSAAICRYSPRLTDHESAAHGSSLGPSGSSNLGVGGSRPSRRANLACTSCRSRWRTLCSRSHPEKRRSGG